MAWRPERPIEIVAGTPPGGGLDRSARALQNAIVANGLLDVSVSVVNVGGEGGRKAWRHIEGFPGDGHVIGISSPNMLADYLMGVTASDPARFAPLAILYSEYIAFVVRAEAAIRSGTDLIRCFARDARSVRIALSTSLGNSNHVAVAKVVRHAGGEAGAADIRVFDTALDAVADVVAGHADIGAITAASAVDELDARRLRAIGVSSPARLAGPYAGVPTWMSLVPGAARAGRRDSERRRSRSGKGCLLPRPEPRTGPWTSSVCSGPRCISTARDCTNISSASAPTWAACSASSAFSLALVAGCATRRRVAVPGARGGNTTGA